MKPWEMYAEQEQQKPWEMYAQQDPIKQRTVSDDIKQGVGNLAAGALRGAGSIGATILAPADMVNSAIAGDGFFNLDRNRQRRKDIDAGLAAMGADPESMLYQGGKLAGEIAGTAGTGGVLAKGVMAAPKLSAAVPNLVPALQSGGFKVAQKATTLPGKIANAAVRTGSAGAVGGAQAGLVNPDDAGTGAVIGAAMPTTFKAMGEAGKLANKAVKKIHADKLLPKGISPEVAALYQKAKSMGIDIPADRIVDSKPLNAAAASLNYVPLSGRMGAEDKMLSQFNRAVSRSFGQDSDNVTAALRKASVALGSKFDDVLQNNAVAVDNQFIDELARHEQTAMNELADDSAKIIKKQIDNILSMSGPDGRIDGQAAYNIKKTLDRIGNRNSPEAFYARDLKKSLMGALNRSLGPDQAAEFAKVRQQYGNMLDLEGLAQNGAEGGVSVARLANMKNINNQELQDLADVAAQFLKSRESPHGAAQRVVMGGLAAAAGAGGLATGTLPFVAAGMGAGRATNTALNSQLLKNMIADRPELYRTLLDTASLPLVRSVPVIGGPGLLN